MDGNGDGSSDDEIPVSLKDEQTPEERRLIRSKYRKILEECQDNKDALVDPSTGFLLDKLLEVNSTFAKVATSREGAQDAKVIALISSLGRQKIQNVQVDTVQFRVADFVDHVFQDAGRRCRATDCIQRDESGQQRMSEQCWATLGEATQALFHRSPAFHCMLGTFERGPVQPRERRVRARLKDEAADGQNKTVVKEVTDKDRDTAAMESTSNDVALRVHPALKRAYNRNGKKPVCYFAFVMNPHSFGQTVENMFHVSFLIRDGKAALTLDRETGLPVIRPVKAEEHGEVGVHGLPRTQLVTSITMAEWREIVEKFEINEPLIPVREQAAPSGSSSSTAAADTSRGRGSSSLGPSSAASTASRRHLSSATSTTAAVSGSAERMTTNSSEDEEQQPDSTKRKKGES